MRTLVHLSDLHFGRVDYAVLEPLVACVNELKPDVVVVSGDLTQRARSQQFKEAREFLDRLPSPQIIVPGNHDVPLHNAYARFFQALDKYKRYITDDLEPFYADEEVAILGINTARSLTIKYGRINEEQVAAIHNRLCAFRDEVTKVIVTHHPFDLPEGHDEDELVGRAELAMEAIAKCGADVLLAGHLHVSHTGQSSARYKIAGHSAEQLRQRAVAAKPIPSTSFASSIPSSMSSGSHGNPNAHTSLHPRQNTSSILTKAGRVCRTKWPPRLITAIRVQALCPASLNRQLQIMLEQKAWVPCPRIKFLSFKLTRSLPGHRLSGGLPTYGPL